jgi:hypothetical protein
MTEQLNEYNDYPKWIDTLTPEQVREWYHHAKQLLLTPSGYDKRLAQAVADYESRHGIE